MADQVKYTQKLKDAKVLVIGGSSGIGYAVAEALIENGCHVTISASNPKKAESTVDRLTKSYPSAKSRIAGQSCNLGDEATLESNITSLLEKVGKVDHIVHTAGDALASMELANVDMEKIKQAGMVRFFSPLMLAKHAPKYLSGGPNSSITLTTGAVSERPIPNWSVIGSYATGLQGMTRQLALDLKPIRVNLVSPGAVNTELWLNSGFSDDQKEAFLKSHGEKMPTGKVPGPEDIAESYLYVLKDRNITGAMISTSGGSLLV
ncbi:uncharacterized protein LTR77_005281 [Saxophila tyrrhenica]|uniref:Uncharacterized protein n=1 Tax=Saxophila tyrrhenica TaxID=1690608 RepID=A0AAV9PBI6_9PEZI|nr:hypothetical protein LTR77_005281 [Saxophila tyrrhenica]